MEVGPRRCRYWSAVAPFQMVVDKAKRLHGCIHGGRPDEKETVAAKLAGESFRLSGRRW